MTYLTINHTIWKIEMPMSNSDFRTDILFYQISEIFSGKADKDVFNNYRAAVKIHVEEVNVL